MTDSKSKATVKVVEKWRRRSVADEITECWICGRDLINPRTLPCLHSFCEECLLALLQTYERKGKLDRIFRCPQCKVLVPNYIPEKVSSAWLRMFPTKRSIDNMKDAINLIEEMCKPCSEKWKIVPATKFCVDCQLFYCTECETDHNVSKDNRKHKVVTYELKELRNVPASNISKFNCPQHKNLRFSTYCESHAKFLCNACMESGQHLGCRVKNNIIEMVRSITKSEAKLHVINHLKHDERNIGKDLVKVIEQIDSIQTQLEDLKSRHTTLYCNYVMQATVTDHKTGAMDALKGKLEFDKNNRGAEAVSKTMTKVASILSEFTSVFADATDDRRIRRDVHKSINEIEKLLSKEMHGDRNGEKVPVEDSTSTDVKPIHRCKRHIEYALSEDDIILLSKAMSSVGLISYSGMAGTAFRVGTKYIMTAAHIVRDIVDPDRTKDSDWKALEDKNVFVTFDGLVEEPTEKFWFHSQVTFLSDQLDVAVLEIKNSEDLPPPLSVSAKVISESEAKGVLTIGFKHCGTLTKFVESGCEIVTSDSEKAIEAIDWLKEEERKYRCFLISSGKEHFTLSWNYDYCKDMSRITLDMHADCRSFGSPVLMKSGKYGLKVVAMLNESLPECFSDLPQILQERFPAEFRLASGTKMSSIYDVVATESRTLANDLFLIDERL